MTESSEESSTTPSSPSSRWRWPLAITVVLIAIVWVTNEMLVGLPVGRAIDDDRNAGITLQARFRYFVDPTTIVLDLRQAENASPADLFRVLLQASRGLAKAGREPTTVVLSRSATPVFVMKGVEAMEIGRSFDAGENPVYLIRTLPEHLYRPSGESAYGTWTGGWLGVFSKQMEDANDAARRWASDGD